MLGQLQVACSVTHGGGAVAVVRAVIILLLIIICKCCVLYLLCMTQFIFKFNNKYIETIPYIIYYICYVTYI